MKPATAPWYRWHFFGRTILLATLPLACSRAPTPEEKVPEAPVKWMEARQLFVEEWTEIVGTTQPLPDRSARVSAAVEGHVVSVLQDAAGKPLVEGQRVQKGDVLVRLDDRIARANRDKVAADLEDLKQQLKQAEVAVKLADIDVKRYRDLLKKDKSKADDIDLVSPIKLEQAELTLQEVKSKQKGTELRIKAGEKQLNALDEQLTLYTLRAPIAGRLGRLLVVLGQTLAIGAPVVEIIDLDNEIDLLCFVPPAVFRKLKEGQLVRLGGLESQSSGQPTKPESKEISPVQGKNLASADGRIVFLADQSEVDTGNFAVKARFPNTKLGLRGNLTLRARVLTTPGRAALTLPESALLEDQDPPAVLVVEDHKETKDKDGKDMEVGKARKLRAKIGIRDRVLGLVEILDVDDPEKKWQGSLETAKFVVERGQGLKNGDPIRLEVEEEEESPADQKNENAP
jgi:RND family efflux transporter MFP subunit